jgi:hypothetical protein
MQVQSNEKLGGKRSHVGEDKGAHVRAVWAGDGGAQYEMRMGKERRASGIYMRGTDSERLRPKKDDIQN